MCQVLPRGWRGGNKARLCCVVGANYGVYWARACAAARNRGEVGGDGEVRDGGLPEGSRQEEGKGREWKWRGKKGGKERGKKVKY